MIFVFLMTVKILVINTVIRTLKRCNNQYLPDIASMKLGPISTISNQRQFVSIINLTHQHKTILLVRARKTEQNPWNCAKGN